MIKSLFIGGITILFVGALFGWMISGISSGVPKGTKADWSLPKAPEDSAPIAEYLHQTILDSGQYGREQSVVVATATTETVEEKVIPFPLIVATARLDDVMIVHLRKSDGTYVTARENDTLEGDWNVLGITMQQVIAEREGSQVEFTVYPDAQGENN